MKEMSSRITKRFLLFLGTVVAFSSLLVVSTQIVEAASASAQCGSDSYADCSGGVRCTATDDVGCACYDSGGQVVSRHSCKYASPEELLD